MFTVLPDLFFAVPLNVPCITCVVASYAEMLTDVITPGVNGEAEYSESVILYDPRNLKKVEVLVG